MSPPTVSVVIPAYNAAPWIERAIRSASNPYQLNCPSEVIVVDDCSTDETALIAARHADMVIRLEKNGGAANALNMGIKASGGKFVSWLSSDDFFLSRYKSATQVEAMNRVGADWSYYAGTLRGTSPSTAKKQLPIAYQWIHDHSRIIRMLLTLLSSPINGSSVMIRKSSLEKYGSFDPSCGNYGADGNLWIRYSLQGAKLAKIKGYGVFYRMPEDMAKHRPNKHFEDWDGRFREIRRLKKIGSLPVGFELAVKTFLKVTRL